MSFGITKTIPQKEGFQVVEALYSIPGEYEFHLLKDIGICYGWDMALSFSLNVVFTILCYYKSTPGGNENIQGTIL